MEKLLKSLSRKFKKKFSLTKREKFALIVAILTLGLLGVQVAPINWRYALIVFLVVLTYPLTAWGLWEDLGGVEWLTLFILPVMYTGAVTLFYFLLPIRWLTRLPTAILFAVGIYAILLVENIYNVAAVRTIQLLRAAYSVGFLLTLLTAFLFFATVVSFRLPSYFNFLIIFLISFPLILQALWPMKLTSRITFQVWLYSFIISFILAQLALVLSFWPIQTISEALFLTTVFYALVGMSQQHLLERLFERTVTEFITVLTIVFLIIFATTHWGG